MDIDSIRARCSSGISVDEGWRPLLITLDAALTEADPELRYLTISQKYGRLSVILTSDTNEEARQLIRDAEEAALKTCEMCGDNTATLCQRGSWLRTLCPSCAAEQKYVVKT
ncbi:hypothetical protein [Mycolicibacterium fallax]|uniref:Uncharacterized protein n=1 Tax=Mycolicibacterium fallax TaxID=1793 RepID=A0A1X1RN75_MYCFA|nr:hypothetical protein [Mycolicibacterium fallax]ORV10036.1 hypothetical protein AWC04_01010 [Mycolicibacterium fallax]BBY98343.1 hypothetical protein MFAL_18100 [Mycolicibacterium fallax]